MAVKNQKKRLVYFDKDFRNGHILASLIQLFTCNSVVPFRSMKEVAVSSEEVANNMRTVRACLGDLGFNGIPSSVELAT